MELSKYIKSESVELNRSAIRFADYNPRKLSEESRKTLKRGIKKFGLVGGIVVNKRTGLTVVSGHQRLSVMDELQKFPDNDYKIRVDVIDVDEQQVKENAQKQAENMDAYVMLSFDTYEAKASFCERFGYDPNTKFIKGEVFDEQIERID